MPAPVISQSAAVHKYGQESLPTFSATASGNIQWSASRGTFTPSTTASGAPTTYTPVNNSDGGINGPPVTVTATNVADATEATTVIEIQATFPYQPNWRGNAKRTLDDKTNISTAEDGSPSFVVKGDPQRVWKYSMLERDVPEWEVIDAFWLHHRKTRWFWLLDRPRALLSPVYYKARIDSALDDDPEFSNNIGYSLVMREAIDA